MVILLYIATAYLVCTSLILWLNRKDFSTLMPVGKHPFSEHAPLVSICIPARNEELKIENCLQSVLLQTYSNIEVLALDDRSTDQTASILSRFSSQTSRKLHILRGLPKPKGWLGKAWACHQLSQKAEGDILLFIDADTTLHKETVARTLRTMGHDVIDFLTLWPHQVLGSFWEKTVIPLVYHALLTLLPVRYVKRPPKWMPAFLHRRLAPYFSAACGQFMAFKREAYQLIGGHQSVKNDIVEDVRLARLIKQHGLKMNMYYAKDSVHCRMYRSHSELYQGFRKNFLAGFNNNIVLFSLMAVLQAIVFVLPFILLVVSWQAGINKLLILSAIAIVLILLQRLLLARWFNWNSLYALLHPLGVGWFEWLGWQAVRDYIKGESATWKGRSLADD